jgi:arylsulfatase A-like enzyme
MFLKHSAVLLFLTCLSSLLNGASPRPNVVFILVDDLGWRDLGIEGSTFYETPHVDRLAASGVRFTQGYAACQVCSPSRASIMTGLYPTKLGITEWIGQAAGTDWKQNTEMLPAHYARSLPEDSLTLAQVFKAHGYATFLAGKWHLGDNEEDLPQNHGFDVNKGGWGKGYPSGGFFSPYENPHLEDGPKGEYLTLRLAQETSQFIEANSENPFFAFLSFYTVHSPSQTTKALWEKYRAKAAGLPQPKSRFILDRRSPVRQVQDNPVYGGMVEAMDTAVGQVLATLEELGLREHTIVVFTSDNGGVSAGDHKATSILPLRGGKGRQWEGGLRVPFYISWPETIQPATIDSPAIGIDFFPTLIELAGLETPMEPGMDGVSLLPALKGEGLPARPLFWHYPHYSNQGGDPSSIIRKGDWKLIHYHENRQAELYNLVRDPGEQSDLSAIYPELTESLMAELSAWLKATGAVFPMPNPNYDAVQAARQRAKILLNEMPSLEKEAAAYLEPDWQPAKGWWEETGL